MKKAQGLSLNVVIISGLILVVLVILALIFAETFDLQGFEKFNPDEHVCGEYDTFYTNNVGHYKFNLDEKGYDCFVDKSIETNHNIKCSKCKDFRDKTPCEICSDKNDCSKEVEEGLCVCDEKEFVETGEQECVTTVHTVIYQCRRAGLGIEFTLNKTEADKWIHEGVCDYITLYPFRVSTCGIKKIEICTKAHEPIKTIEINLETEKCVEWTNESKFVSKMSKFKIECSEMSRIAYDKHCCIKKEEKNECEKNNPDYTLEIKGKYYLKDGEKYRFCSDPCNYTFIICGCERDCSNLQLRNESCEDYEVFEKFCRKKNECEKGNEDFVLLNEKCLEKTKKTLNDCYTICDGTDLWRHLGYNELRPYEEIQEIRANCHDQCNKLFRNPYCEKKEINIGKEVYPFTKYVERFTCEEAKLNSYEEAGCDIKSKQYLR